MPSYVHILRCTGLQQYNPDPSGSVITNCNCLPDPYYVVKGSMKFMKKVLHFSFYFLVVIKSKKSHDLMPSWQHYFSNRHQMKERLVISIVKKKTGIVIEQLCFWAGTLYTVPLSIIDFLMQNPIWRPYKRLDPVSPLAR
jgi:hypothetical protein